MNKPTLVILAAGMGSRYGGLKQIDALNAEGDTIIDFSLYDALRAGFGKFVFIIRRSFEREFKEIFNKKLEGKADVAYIYQELENVPEKYINPNRIKPWGTGHALLMAEEAITGNFAIINADDFYGAEAFETMAKHLIKTDKNSFNFSTMAYLLKNTVSDHGYVSRGECQVNEKGYLTSVNERTHIEKIDGKLRRKDAFGNFVSIDENTIVSMNFWGFTPKCFEFGSALFMTFLEENKENHKAEFYIPSVVNDMLKSDKVHVEVLKSDAKWFGVTYKEDKEIVQKAIADLKHKNRYPTNLWCTLEEELKSVFNQFEHKNEFESYVELASGHINDTYLIKTDEKPYYVLQRINDGVFKDVPGLINNKISISDHIKDKLSHLPKETLNRRVLSFVKTKTGDKFYKADTNSYWNMTIFIDDSVTFETINNEKVAYEGGKLFGEFLQLTNDFNVSNLIEVIPRFHDMSFRYSQFEDALETASEKRLNKSKPYLTMVENYRAEMHILQSLKESGAIKSRVTHNDTKISNALFDLNNEGLCVIDTDTVMSGIVHYDFGDAIRTICNTATEDETNLDLVAFNKTYYKAYKRGFLEKVESSLSPLEIIYLPLGAKTIIFIMALRFLTDYLNGDVYYKTKYPDHNFDRAKNQFKLLQSFSEKIVQLERESV
ncbi:phosphotransferase [Flavivirga amylovorans]|uniref:Phosphotransferase n=1 Tax=Flavivirga amylovorans TaxID=870486 RepID=A0ABT8WYJ5_9FLAO|nr:phosphotransferase [Flavivirga amylovorans]MDO5986760.1 phosphotransferase [Flavivirga amylovorans]